MQKIAIATTMAPIRLVRAMPNPAIIGPAIAKPIYWKINEKVMSYELTLERDSRGI